MKKIRINGEETNVRVNTNADTIWAKETIKAGLCVGAGIWALCKGFKHYFEAGRNCGMCNMVDIVNNDLNDSLDV